MKGAAALPPARARTPRPTITSTIGKSHHFLFRPRNARKSRTKPDWVSRAARSKALRFSVGRSSIGCRSELAKIVSHVRRWLAPEPIRIGRRSGEPPKRIAPDQTKYEGHRQEEHDPDRAEHHRRRHHPERDAHRHPPDVDESSDPGDECQQAQETD